jgi:hypothetical protein
VRSRPIIIPAPEDSDESPFSVRDELTIVEAAMIYAGRHPSSRLLRDASLEDVEIFLGREAQSDDDAKPKHRGAQRRWAAARRLSWDIYCTLKGMVERGEIKPVRESFSPSGKLDPRRTTIRTADVADLAKQRGERPEYLAGFFDADKPHRAGPVMVPAALDRERKKPHLEVGEDRRRAHRVNVPA